MGGLPVQKKNLFLRKSGVCRGVFTVSPPKFVAEVPCATDIWLSCIALGLYISAVCFEDRHTYSTVRVLSAMYMVFPSVCEW